MARRGRLISGIIALLIVLALVGTGRTTGSGDEDGVVRVKTTNNSAPVTGVKRVAPKAGEAGAAWISAMNAQPERARAIAADNGMDWCQTQIAYARRYPNRANPLQAQACPFEGNCDAVVNRDAAVPDPADPKLTVRLKFNIFRNDDGSNAAATLASAEAQVAQLNSDYDPSRISFIYTTQFINSTQFRDFSDSEESAMKTAFVDQPDYQINVYVVNILDGYIGVGTFPWDPAALGTMGGIIVDDNYFGAGEKTLTHELGHNLGLWHTHHGVSEVAPCSACWELADKSNGDVAGDFCSDTDPTPVNYNCSSPNGVDQCSHTQWGPTDPQNYMGYAPDFCYTEFTPQQWGRMHCWIASQLGSFLAIGFTAAPPAGEGPLPVDFTYDTPIPTSAWNWQFGDGDSALVQNPSHLYAPGIYDVSLVVQTDYGQLSVSKPEYITVWADTMQASDTSVLAGVQGYWEISGTNALPIKELYLPLTLTNVTSVLFFDSVSFVGTRLAYFESRQVVFDNRFAGQVAYRVIADNGGGSPPLPPGSGPLARVHFRSRSTASVGDTSHLSAGPLGTYSLQAVTLTTGFAPVFNEATLRIKSDCDCSAQGDIDSDGEPTALDLGVLIDYIFAGGVKPPVDPLCPHNDRGDMNCDAYDDMLDLGLMIDWLYAGASGPCDPCTCISYPTNCP